MTYGRTQEEQVDALHKASENALRQDRSDYHPGLYRSYLHGHIQEAEARGAAELADALEECLSYIEFYEDRHGNEFPCGRKARKALAKARGESA